MPIAIPSQIVVEKPIRTDRTTVEYEIHATRPIREYFSSQKMFVTYDVDVTDVPDAILLIPVLSTVAPIAWILGAELRTPDTDAVFLEALLRIRRSLQHLHPTIEWGGDVRSEAIVDCRETYLCERGALLFSGGVDSLASFVLHRQEKPRLVSVWGADIGLHRSRQWECVAAANLAFADTRSLDISFIKTNFRIFFNDYKLRARFLGTFPNWYSGVQQGLGLVGLCAPLSYLHGLGRVLIPSTHTADSDQPWGSHPTIDGNVRWGSTEAVHDGYHLSRQMKLRVLARYIREEDRRLQLRVCWGRESNCCRCAKCCLTMLGLALEGLDPNDHGFRFDSTTLAHIRTGLVRGRIDMSDTAVRLWMEIQRNIPTRTRLDLVGLDQFFDWLQGVSMQRCKARYEGRIRTVVRRYLETRQEPVGRWIRMALGHPFP